MGSPLRSRILSLLACTPTVLAQKPVPEPRLGLQFTPPKGWSELPADLDRHATLRLFAAPRAMASRGDTTHTPVLRVMFFNKGGDDSKDVVDKLPRTTPFRGLADFARRGLGAKEVAEEPQKAAGVQGVRITGKEIPGEHVLFGQTVPLDDGEAAVCVEVLSNQVDKIKKEIDAVFASLEPVARVPVKRPEVPWLADAEWATKPSAARTAVRRQWAEALVAATAKNPEVGYKVSKAKYWTVLSACDPATTSRFVVAAEAARDWLSKRLPELTKDAPLPAVLRVFDSVDQFNALLLVRGDQREFDSLHRELYCVHDRDNSGRTGYGPVLRAVLWQLCDDVDPGVLPALPRWFDNGCWEVLRSSTFDGKKFEFAAGDVERGRIDYYRQNKQDMPFLWDLIQEHKQPSPTDGKAEDPWGYTPECSRLMRWFWFFDGQKAFDKPNLVSDYVKGLGMAYWSRGPSPVADVPTVGLDDAQTKDRNTRHYKWRDTMLVDVNNLVIPLPVDTWKAINEKWLAFNKNFK
ncbi:MAG: hypothetical protein WAT39_12750 [Planctomycetota bacterium]